MKKTLIITASILAVIAVAVLCVALFANKKEEDPWKDYYGNDEVYSINLNKEIEDLPGVVFNWTPSLVNATYGGMTNSIIYGFPVWNVFFYDLTGDGVDDICTTVSVEEDGVISDRIVIQDYPYNVGYEVSDPGNFNFRLKQDGDKLVAIRECASDKEESITGSIVFNGSVMQFVPDGQ